MKYRTNELDARSATPTVLTPRANELSERVRSAVLERCQLPKFGSVVTRRRTGMGLVGVAVAVVASALATPAYAAQGTRPCPPSSYCFCSNAVYGAVQPGQPNWHLNYNTTRAGSFLNAPSSSGDRRNQLSSVINNGSRTICIYDDINGGRRLILWVGPYQDVSYVEPDDRADRWTVNPRNVPCSS